MADAILTQERLKQLLDYNPHTGIFTRKIRNANAIKVGDLAGTVSNTYGYVRISLDNRIYEAHRLVWLYVYGEWPSKQIDHINGIRTDNRLSNLREASALENMRNKKMQINNKSGYKGVSWDSSKLKWRATSAINKKQVHLGRYDTAFEAHLAYEKFANDNFGEFIRV